MTDFRISRQGEYWEVRALSERANKWTSCDARFLDGRSLFALKELSVSWWEANDFTLDMPDGRPRSARSVWAWLTLTALGAVVLLGVVGLIQWGRAASERAKREEAAQTQLMLEDRRKGFHCLSAWDGSNADFVALVKQRLRDPGSFEHVETTITPVDERGEHRILMKYRARNGFGGMNLDIAAGTVRQSDCSATLSSVE